MPSADEWRGRVALVTGASGSIGAEVSRVLAAGGASVGVVGRNAAALDSLVAEIEAAGGAARAYVADVRDAQALADVVADLPGPVDVLVPLAGGDGAPSATAELDPARWRAVLETDLTSVFLTVHAALPGMMASCRVNWPSCNGSYVRSISQVCSSAFEVVFLSEAAMIEYVGESSPLPNERRWLSCSAGNAPVSRTTISRSVSGCSQSPATRPTNR